jgi:hypothetical protein
MLFNKLTCPLVFAVLLVAGLAFVATPATAQLPATTQLSVTDTDNTTTDIEVSGFIDQSVTFALTVTFPEAVTDFVAADVQLQAANIVNDVNIPVPNGATVSGFAADATFSVYNVTITAGPQVDKVWIAIDRHVAETFGTLTDDGERTGTRLLPQSDQNLLVEIDRSEAPPLTLVGTPSIADTPSFTVTLTSIVPITLTNADINVTGGYIERLLPDTAKKVWTVTIVRGVGRTQVTVGPATNGAHTFTARTFFVSATAVITTTAPTGISFEVIFSEIANRNNNANEWIEFKNRSGLPQNVNGWTVSIVTAVNRDEFLFSLPNVTIPAGGVLLVTDKDPGDAGSSLAKAKNSPLWSQVNIGALPNEGSFILVLRKSNNRAHLGTANHIVDVAGYFPNAAQAAALIGQSAPSIKNNLRANKVYWRQHEDIVGTSAKGITDADAAFQPIGFTGVGYERAADPTDENGGTPGYPNDIRSGDIGGLTGDVTISEIMFATDGSSNEVQWIELYNSSKTEAVALDAYNGWSLIIENYDDPNSTNEPLSGEINFKDNGGVKTILPNQTVLIVSSPGRNSSRDHFPSSRVFDVYTEVSGEFDMDSRRDPFLNPTVGFYIELVDGRDRTADEVGNLDLRARRNAEPAWELPMGRTEDGDRTSIIRRYRTYRAGRYSNEGVVQDGTEREGWIPAANTDFRDFSRDNSTWYGSDTDYGTPGLRAGQALPVQLSQFRPDRTETGTVVIQWTTESEMDNAGFNILRSQTRMGEFKVINAQMIPGAGTTAERNTYTWTDTTTKPNVVYYYQIEDVSFDGERQTLATVRLRGLISAKGKLTTQWGELKHSRD